MPRGVYIRTSEHIVKLKKNGFQKGHQDFTQNKGRKHSLEFRLKASENSKKRIGEKGANWKGGYISRIEKGIGVYRNIHKWVQENLGTPDTCVYCGKTGLTGHKIHWANKSREYKLILDDWLRLCASCHKKYDNEFQ